MELRNLLSAVRGHSGSRVAVRAGTDVVTKTFAEFAADVDDAKRTFARQQVALGGVIGICSPNCYEWLVYDIAAIDMGLVIHALPERASEPIGSIVDRYHLAGLLSDQMNAGLAEGRLGLDLAWSESGASTVVDDADVLTLVHSSGSSGVLKGLIISRRGTEHLISRFIDAYSISGNDSHVIFLPLSNYQQRMAVYACLHAGVSFLVTPYAYFFHDVPKFAPTFLIGPPALYDAISNAVGAGCSPDTAKARFTDLLGGNIRFMITGMAPIRRGTLEYFAAQGFPLYEAYGMGEAGMASWNYPGHNSIGTVGIPVDPGAVTIGPDSEIVLQPPVPLSKGYFEDPLSEVSTIYGRDGRIYTGDVGRFDGHHLVLTGRKKELIATAGGTKFHPSEIEDAIRVCSSVRQCVVFMEERVGRLAAVVSVSAEMKGVAAPDVASHVEQLNKTLPLDRRIGRTIVTDVQFCPENGLLTRNLKPDRARAREMFLKG